MWKCESCRKIVFEACGNVRVAERNQEIELFCFYKDSEVTLDAFDARSGRLFGTKVGGVLAWHKMISKGVRAAGWS